MDLKSYFTNHPGSGVLATADEQGLVDIAVYASPHVIDDQTIAFIMRDRLSHQNLQSNPHAAYLFLEEGQKHLGKRLYLTPIKEESDPNKIEALRRRSREDQHPEETKYLVTFRIDKVRPVVEGTLSD